MRKKYVSFIDLIESLEEDLSEAIFLKIFKDTINYSSNSSINTNIYRFSLIKLAPQCFLDILY